MDRYVIQPYILLCFAMYKITAQTIDRRIIPIKIRIVIIVVGKDNVLTVRAALILDEIRTVIEPHKESIVFLSHEQRKKLLEQRDTLPTTHKPPPRRAFHASVARRHSLIEKAHSPKILTLRAQQVIIFIRARDTDGIRAYIETDIKLSHFSSLAIDKCQKV